MARRKLSSDINVVPYIDVMLVLLIIFMITAPLMTQGVDVELPKTDSQPMPTPQEPLILSVDVQGRYFLNKGDEPSHEIAEKELLARMTETLQAKPDTMVLVQGDTKVSYGEVAHAMSLLQQAGIKKIGFVTKPQDAQTH